MFAPALQFAISLAFVYLLLSALCSAIQELIANLGKWRANTLEAGISNLLQDEGLKNDVYNHVLVKGIWRPSWLIKKVSTIHKPAYISSSMFAQVVQDLRATQGNALPAAAKKALDTLLVGINDAEEQKKKIEHWFDDAMDAVSGWYKRKANAWLWVIAGVVCVALNADTISIGKMLWDDPTARAALVQSANEYVAKKVQAQEGANAQGTTQSAADLEKEARARLQAVKDARTTLNGLSIPLGWCAASESGNTDSSCTPERQWPTGDGWILKLLGLLITVLAVSQGAPFWFDLLQKAVNLRLAGDPPPDSRPAKQAQS
jgi:hypothetical protein